MYLLSHGGDRASERERERERERELLVKGLPHSTLSFLLLTNTGILCLCTLHLIKAKEMAGEGLTDDLTSVASS
jgi:hypothetical protein